MSSVSREKYERAKEVARIWYEKFTEEEHKTKDLLEEVERLKELSIPDNTELEEKVSYYEKLLRKTKREFADKEETYKNLISNMEREKILHEGRIQQLEEVRRDLKERYDELKQDFREQRKKD